MMAQDLILTRREAIKEIKRPGRVFVNTRLTKDDEFFVEVIKTGIVHLLSNGNWCDDLVKFEARRDENGLYLGW